MAGNASGVRGVDAGSLNGSALLGRLPQRLARAYIGCDDGIAVESIMLGATERGLGGCMIGSIKLAGLREVLDIPERHTILLVLALGVPMEKVRDRAGWSRWRHLVLPR